MSYCFCYRDNKISKVTEKPIFIVGSGRSGTTVFYNLLALHPDVSWFSNYSDRFLWFRPMPFFHRALDMPGIGRRMKQSIIANRKRSLLPSEAGRIYHDYCGFRYDIKTTEEDLTSLMVQRFNKKVALHQRLTGKERFLNKQTANNQRIRVIDHIYKDAFYIHMIRDGRAVANSLHNIKWWADTDIWWLGKKSREWEKEGREPIELCALQWQHDVEEVKNNQALFPDRYFEIKYENFASDVRGTMSKLLDFCELSPAKDYLELLPPTLPSQNFKWREDLTQKQQDVLLHTIRPFLDTLGYD